MQAIIVRTWCSLTTSGFLKLNSNTIMSDNESDIPSENIDPPPLKHNVFKRVFDLLWPFGRSPDTKEALEHEIQELLEEGEEQGLISSLEEQMITSIFDFRDTVVVEVMTPAAEIVSMEISSSVADIANCVIGEGFTRIPLYKENPDRVIGILHAKDLLKICMQPPNEGIDLGEYLKPADSVQEDSPIVDLLRDFQKKKTHMAIVTDEFGTVRGLVTLEDILEEIVGEIDDEYDVEEKDIEIVDDNTILVQAKIDIEEVEDQFDLQLPEGPYESVGGMMIHSLGRIARVGDFLKFGELRFTVKSASRRHVNSVEVKRITEESEE